MLECGHNVFILENTCIIMVKVYIVGTSVLYNIHSALISRRENKKDNSFKSIFISGIFMNLLYVIINLYLRNKINKQSRSISVTCLPYVNIYCTLSKNAASFYRSSLGAYLATFISGSDVIGMTEHLSRPFTRFRYQDKTAVLLLFSRLLSGSQHFYFRRVWSV